jgi:SnoaL-like domain
MRIIRPDEESEMISATQLVDFHEICQLKYRYIRALDTQDWDLLEACFTADIVLWPNGGDYVARGRDNVMALVKAILIDSFYTSHLAVHPEIEFLSDTQAKGTWRLQDRLLYTAPHPALTHTEIRGGEQSIGAGYYYDEYLRTDGVWQIASCGFMRIFESLKRPGAVDSELVVFPGRGTDIRTEEKRAETSVF